MTNTEQAHPDRSHQAGTGTGHTDLVTSGTEAVSRHTIEAEARALAEIERHRAELPALDPAVFACYLGGLVGKVEADTEADPVAILASLVCAAGVYLGPGPHVRAGDDTHPLLIWPLVVGRTSAGRKGASWSTAKRLITAADPDFMTTNLRSGLTSGEGLAQMFAEPDATHAPRGPVASGDDSGAGTPVTSPSDADLFGQAATKPRAAGRGGRDSASGGAGRLPLGDSRLLVFEPEWAAVMARMKREGNSLSATLRAAWEGGDLSTMGVNARIAPTSHIGLLAHITPSEFKAKVSHSDMAGGTYNRFLPVAVARSKFLPFAQGADAGVVDGIGAQLRDRLHAARRAGTLGFTRDGAALWRDLYVEFGTDAGDGGAVEQFISRSAPNCLRIAALYAALDQASGMDAGHLAAAAALVRYSIASARAVFSDDPTLGRLAAFIVGAGPIGRTQHEIRAGHFQGNRAAADVQALLDKLVGAGRISQTKRPPEGGRGRPTQVYTANPPAEPPPD